MSPSTPQPDETRARLGSQTLERGLDVLQAVVDSDQALSISEVASATSLNRSVTYRLLRSLESRGFVAQVDGQGYRAGLGLLRLMPRLRQSLTERARPILMDLARQVGATVVLTVRDREQEVCLLCVQPPSDGPFISFREGAATKLGLGASSLALLALGAARPGERSEVTAARDLGPLAVVRTSGELRPGTAGLALALPGEPDLAISVVFFDGSLDEASARDYLSEAGRRLGPAGPA